MSNMQSTIYIPCVQCGHYVFANRGGEMHTTGICRVCREFGGRKSQQELSPPKIERIISDADANPFQVRPGQTWVSLDPRDDGREIEVIDLDLDAGQAVVLSHGKGGSKKRRVKLTNFTRIKGRGYEVKTRHDSSIGRAAAS